MLRQQILPQVRGVVGERRVTLAFDREGWSPTFFQETFAQGFDVYAGCAPTGIRLPL